MTVDGGDTSLTLSCWDAGPMGLVLALSDHRVSDLIGSMSSQAATGDFASSVAHRFNNALTVVLGQVELLSILLDLDDESAAKLQAIRNQGGQAAELARRIQRLGRRVESETPIVGLRAAVEVCLEKIDPSLAVGGEPCVSLLDLTRGHLYRLVESTTRSLKSSSGKPVVIKAVELAASHRDLPDYLIHTGTSWTRLTVCNNPDVTANRGTEAVNDDWLDGLASTLKRNGCHLHGSSSRFGLFIPHLQES